MTELSVAVTRRDTLTLINPPPSLLCSPNPISSPLCLVFGLNKWTAQSTETEGSWRTHLWNKTTWATDVSPGAPGTPQVKKHIKWERQGEKQEKKKLPSPVVQSQSALKVSVTEEWCGECDHSFNLKLSGVNKDYVAQRHRGQDYLTPLCCSSFPLLLKENKGGGWDSDFELFSTSRQISQQKYIWTKSTKTTNASWWKLVSYMWIIWRTIQHLFKLVPLSFLFSAADVMSLSAMSQQRQK